MSGSERCRCNNRPDSEDIVDSRRAGNRGTTPESDAETYIVILLSPLARLGRRVSFSRHNVYQEVELVALP